jgi:hypothetical protein
MEYTSGRIAFVDCSNREYRPIFRLTSPGKIAYCRRMGFDFLAFDFDMKDRTQHWGRILGMKEFLPRYDWLVYLDTDSLITNPKFDIRQIIEGHPQASIITGPMPHEGHIGTNGMILRNCGWVEGLLDEWYACDQFVDSPYFGTFSAGTHDDGGFSAPPEKWKFYEQSAFHYLYDTREDVRSNTAIVPRKYMHGVPRTHCRGDFLIHFPGMSMERKVASIRHHLSLLTL